MKTNLLLTATKWASLPCADWPIVDFKGDLPVHVYVEMEVGHFYLFEHIRQLDVFGSLDFLAVYHKANRNRVPQFRCDFSCFHCNFHLSFLLGLVPCVSHSLHTTGGKARLFFITGLLSIHFFL